MAKQNYLDQIKKRIDSLQKEYSTLTEAYKLLSSVTEGASKSIKIPNLEEISMPPAKAVKKVKGKRGRPAGAKNKPGYKKPGPKITQPKAVETKVKASKAPVVKAPAPKTPAVKAPAVKTTAKAPAKISKKASSPAKSKGARVRIPDLAERIQAIVAKNGRFTTNSMITDKLASLYPNKSRSDLGKYISVILANMKSRSELGVVTVDAKGQKMRSGLWGLTKWFDKDKPKAEFLK